jgi:hypothetical protein
MQKEIQAPCKCNITKITYCERKRVFVIRNDRDEAWYICMCVAVRLSAIYYC